MTEDRPWATGRDHAERWAGYLDRDTGILRNLVGARTWEDLRVVEDRLVEWRAAQLLVTPVPATFDAAHLQGIHAHLFQDVYEWAGEFRTVNMGRPGGPRFEPYELIEANLHGVAEAIAGIDQLRGMDLGMARQVLPYVYDAVNTTHPFREGNGRTQRVFLGDLAAQSGLQIDWTRVAGSVNDHASQAAREGDPEPMRAMFASIVTETSARAARNLAAASFPSPPSAALQHYRPQPARPAAPREYGKPRDKPYER